MNQTMLGELARLFSAESRDRVRQTVGASAAERTAHLASAHRLQQISNEFRNRQMSAGLLDSIIPIQGVIQNAATGISGSTDGSSTDNAAPASPFGSAASAVQDLTKRANDALNQASANAQGAGNQAEQAGQQASQAGSVVSTVVLASAVGLVLFLLFTRK